MVWGLVNPSGFGDYFPDGDYVGWEEAIKRYFDEEMSVEQRAAYDNRDVSYRGDVSRKFTEDMGPLEVHERPREFRTVQTYKSLGSLIKLNSRLLAVDGNLKDIIETIEPGVHQFWPIQITMPKNRQYPVPYYGMVIRRFLNSFVPEESEGFQVQLGYQPGVKSYYCYGKTKDDYAHLTISKILVNGAHIWCENKLGSPRVLISDDLQAEIAGRGLRIFKHHKMNGI